MKKVEELIQKVKDNKVAILNDGTIEQLREVLLACFPLESCKVNPIFKYFYAGVEKNCTWYCDIQTSLPTVSVKEFYEDEFVWGEEVEVSYNAVEFRKALYCCINPDKNGGYIAIVKNSEPYSYTYIRKLPLKTKLTHQMIADKFGVVLGTFEIIN